MNLEISGVMPGRSRVGVALFLFQHVLRVQCQRTKKTRRYPGRFVLAPRFPHRHFALVIFRDAMKPPISTGARIVRMDDCFPDDDDGDDNDDVVRVAKR